MAHDETGTASQRTRALSKTAIWVAAARAIGAREPDSGVRNPDFLAERLLGDPAQLALEHPIVDALRASYDDAMQDIETAGIVRAMIERTRFIDDALERAIRAGATQVLIPGAGFDSHAYRARELLTGTRVFEIDRPATLAHKRRRVDEALGGPPPNLTYVPLDLEQDDLPGALARHGYDASQRTFVILEGVTMYMTEPGFRSTFRFVASHPRGSSIVFDFATRTMVEGLKLLARNGLANIPPVARPALQRFLDMTQDEPWLFGFPVGAERELLAELDLELRELVTIGSEESAKRYLTKGDGTTVGAAGHAKAEAMRKAAQAATAHLGPEERQKAEQWRREQERQMAYRIAEAAVA